MQILHKTAVTPSESQYFQLLLRQSPLDLIVLDHLIWLGIGKQVADLLHCDQSTVSRKAEACCEFFKLGLQKTEGEWTLLGSNKLIQQKRLLHQLYRLEHYAPLRLGVSNGAAQMLKYGSLPDWCARVDNLINPNISLQLLIEGVIDAWLCSQPEELLALDCRGVAIKQLCNLPLLIIGHQSHSLFRPGTNLEIALKANAIQVASATIWPKRCGWLRKNGLQTKTVLGQRHSYNRWDKLVDDGRALQLGTQIQLEEHPEWRAVEIDLNCSTGLSLVVTQEMENKKSIKELEAQLSAIINSTGRDG